MSTAKDLDALLKRYMARDLPGAALSVCRGEEVLYEGIFGSRDMAGPSP